MYKFLIVFFLFVGISSCRMSSTYSSYQFHDYVNDTVMIHQIDSKLTINRTFNWVKFKTADSIHRYEIDTFYYNYPKYTIFKFKNKRSGMTIKCLDGTKISYSFANGFSSISKLEDCKVIESIWLSK